MTIEIAIETLQQYKLCNKTRRLSELYPFEMRRRDAYVDNVIRQLSKYYVNPQSITKKLISDDIKHCISQKYYPQLPFEGPQDGFSFTTTMEDVARLLECDELVICAA